MSTWKKVLAALLLSVVLFAVYLIIQIRSFEVESLSEDLFVLRGIGGNSTVLNTTQGNVIIDSMTLPMQGKIIRAKARQLTGKDTTLLINTHYHLDHTHGNPGFAPDTRIISTERTLSHLQFFDTDFWTDNSSFIPNETFTDDKVLNIGGKTLHLVHPGRGHTDGDLVVFIEQEGTAVLGDLMFYKYYPNIDLEAGGSVQEWSATLDTVLEHEFEKVIPGHGDTTDRAGIQNFQRFIGQLAEVGRAAAANGDDLQKVLASGALDSDADFSPLKFAGIPLGLDREFVLQRTWEESTGNFERKN
ncbi:MAG: MBL fold metallo-hydrolase [Arenicella sp.]|nr:MBL fold metallo-hydrolase [Arenicella sp.]